MIKMVDNKPWTKTSASNSLHDRMMHANLEPLALAALSANGIPFRSSAFVGHIPFPLTEPLVIFVRHEREQPLT